jgi:hypothetical protein
MMTGIYTFEAAKTRAMRVLKAIYLAGLFTLAMGLFCGELPESIRLLDDTTNDYVADSSASAARESIRETEFTREQAASQVRNAAAVQQFRQVVLASEPAKPARASGKELLPLLSIRRT